MMFQLDDYQERPYELLVNRKRFGLFDEMGVGKTPPTVRAVCHVRDNAKRPTIITVPGYAMQNWVNEFAKWAPDVNVGVCWQRFERDRRQHVLESSAYDVILINYHMWQTYPVLTRQPWHGFVWDECHRMRGRNNAWTKQAFKLQNADNKNRDSRFWFLTGSPIVRDAGDLWPFLHMQDRPMFNSYWEFVNTVCETTVNPWYTEVGKVRNPDRFSRMMARYSIRRLCADIPQLAHLTSVEQNYWIDLPESVMSALRQAKREYILQHDDYTTYEADGVGALIAKMAQWCSVPPTKENPKLDALKELLNDAPNERVIVWCWYTRTAEAVRKMLAGDPTSRKKRRTVAMITGDSSDTARSAALRTYDNEQDTVLIATIAAVSESVNLQAGRKAIFLEESNLPSENEQAIRRQKRRGQNHPVQVVRLLARGPKSYVVDAARRALLETRGRDVKAALIREILSNPT